MGKGTSIASASGTTMGKEMAMTPQKVAAVKVTKERARKTTAGIHCGVMMGVTTSMTYSASCSCSLMSRSMKVTAINSSSGIMKMKPSLMAATASSHFMTPCTT